MYWLDRIPFDHTPSNPPGKERYTPRQSRNRGCVVSQCDSHWQDRAPYSGVGGRRAVADASDRADSTGQGRSRPQESRRGLRGSDVKWENVGAGRLRHADHRFEWDRREFREWAEGIAGRFGYLIKFVPIGPNDLELGSPTQMGVFEKS
jgi:hypothetical protein